MKFLKAITTEGKTEYFNINHILTITQNGSTVKILMGAGLYWNVKPETIEFIEIENVVNDIMGGY